MIERLFALAVLLLTTAGATAAVGPDTEQKPVPPLASGQAIATFAGGCFWCMEPAFDGVKGVVATISGYTGGQRDHPTYEEVSAGETGHAESLLVIYEPATVSYEQLLDVFWHNIDPVAVNRQFCDGGTQYRSAIFVNNEDQAKAAAASKDALAASGKLPGPIVTEIVPATTFYPAEEYHQDYYLKNPVRYKFYRFNCGRDERLQELWGKSAH